MNHRRGERENENEVIKFKGRRVFFIVVGPYNFPFMVFLFQHGILMDKFSESH